ncbi:MAG: hypothetical protein ACKVOY_21240 [Burkholderiaceae bacterium]
MKNTVHQHETQAFAHRLRNAMRQARLKTSATVLANGLICVIGALASPHTLLAIS